MQSDSTPQHEQPPEAAVSELKKKVSNSCVYSETDHESSANGLLKETNAQCIHATTMTTNLEEKRSINKVNGLSSNVENGRARSEQEDSDSQMALSDFKQESKLTDDLLSDPKGSRSGKVLNDKAEVSYSVDLHFSETGYLVQDEIYIKGMKYYLNSV